MRQQEIGALSSRAFSDDDWRINWIEVDNLVRYIVRLYFQNVNKLSFYRSKLVKLGATVGRGRNDKAPDLGEVQHEVFAARVAGAFILDVRQPDEWNEAHIPGATLIPLDKLEARLNEVPKDKEVVVVCQSGNRSQPGRDILKTAGFKQVTSMTGALKEWKAAGLPTVTGP